LFNLFKHFNKLVSQAGLIISETLFKFFPFHLSQFMAMIRTFLEVLMIDPKFPYLHNWVDACRVAELVHGTIPIQTSTSNKNEHIYIVCVPSWSW